MPKDLTPYLVDGVGGRDINAMVDALEAGQVYARHVYTTSFVNVDIRSLPANIDGQAMQVGWRFVLAGQTVAAENGEYEYTAAGSAARLIQLASHMSPFRQFRAMVGSTMRGKTVMAAGAGFNTFLFSDSLEHGLLYRNQIAADVQVTGTTTEDVIATLTLPMSTVATLRRSIRFKALGIFGANAGGKTLQTKLKIGGATPAATDIVQDSGALVHISGRQWIFEGEIYVRALGAAATAKFDARCRYMEESIPTAAEVMVSNVGTNFLTTTDVTLMVTSQSNDNGNENNCTHFEAEVYAE